MPRKQPTTLAECNAEDNVRILAHFRIPALT